MRAPWRLVLEQSLLRIWSRRGPAATLLWPVSLLFHGLVASRRLLYRYGICTSRRVNACVVVVGNSVVGGAGKTPTVISIVQHLVAQGLRVGVVSRGFGRSRDNCEEVGSTSTPESVGDEPLLIYRNTQAPVFVSRKRYQAATALLAQYPETEIIVCDDGLQHYALYRDVEVCVFDDRGCGNGWLLPAGPLREPWPRKALTTVGQHPNRLLVLNTSTPNPQLAKTTQPKHPTPLSGYTAQRSLRTHGVRQNGSTVALETLHAPGAQPLMAVAGIAQPENFFRMLQALNLPLAKTLALPDHYDFDSLSRSVHAGYQLICTEKDAYKLWARVPDAIAVPLVQTAEPAFFQQLDACVAAQMGKP